MADSPIDLVIRGQVVTMAGPAGLATAEAIAIAGGRIVRVGTRREVGEGGPGARVIDAGEAAVIPGLHDFHIHLVGLARSRSAILLDDACDAVGLTDRLRSAVRARPVGWITGRGWNEAQLAGATDALEAAVGDQPAFLTSHDGHSGWASKAARRAAGLGRDAPEPAGGRIERGPGGEPTGVLRETAMDLVAPLVPRVQGEALRELLAATLRELAAFGMTGASEAGDYTDANGVGPDAVFGDSYSSLTDIGEMIDGRLRLTLGIPADALPAAVKRGLRTGAPLAGRRTMRFGWAKEYADGALGSGTAALFEPATCGDRDTGIMRVSPDELDSELGLARPAGIGMAIHAIGDRAVAEVIDAIARSPSRRAGVPNDRMEHAQLVRPAAAGRFAELGVTASIQPIHAASDRDLVESCWAGGDRPGRAYAWRRLLAGEALLAAGSDAPVESVNPWLGIFAAVHRRSPGDNRADWRPDQALTIGEALAAYTLGPARAIGAADEGHLSPGARADLAILSVPLEVLLQADEGLADVRSVLTLVDGQEVHGAQR